MQKFRPAEALKRVPADFFDYSMEFRHRACM